MEQLKNIEEILINQVQTQMGNLEYVDAKELGEVMDMIKDIEEAIYYCTITKAMEHEEKHEINYYMTNYPSQPYYNRDMDKNGGRMYYTPSGKSNSGNNNSNTNYNNGGRYTWEENYPSQMMRDSREGRSPISRKTYMESKEKHQDMTKQLQSLEQYMYELTDDIMEMVNEATPDEKQMLKNKINLLAQKIV